MASAVVAIRVISRRLTGMTSTRADSLQGDSRSVRPARVYSAIAGAVVAIAFSSIIITVLERDRVPPLVVALYRMALTCVLLVPAVLARQRREMLQLLRTRFIPILFAGFCLAVHFGSWIASLQYIPIARSVVLVSSHPLLVVVASYLLLRERPTRPSIIGVVVGTAGTAVICWGGLELRQATLTGDGLALLGALSLVGYVIVGRRIRGAAALLAYVTPLYAVCTLVLLASVLVAGDPLYPYSTGNWLHFGLLAVVPTILGHTVLNWALRYVKASAISIAFLGEPVVAAVLAFLFFAQIPGLSTLAGGFLVLAGIYFATLGSMNPARKKM
jgi:drug/metabolite transporter (DMT)-like permease